MPKMTVDFNEQVTQMLEDLASREGRSKVEILRRAIGIYSFLDDEVREGKEEGRRVAVTDKDKKILKEIVWTF